MSNEYFGQMTQKDADGNVIATFYPDPGKKMNKADYLLLTEEEQNAGTYFVPDYFDGSDNGAFIKDGVVYGGAAGSEPVVMNKADWLALPEEERNTGEYLIPDYYDGSESSGESGGSSGGSLVNEWYGTLEEFEALESTDENTNYYISGAERMNLGLSFFPDYAKVLREFTTAGDSWVATKDCALVGYIHGGTGNGVVYVDGALVGSAGGSADINAPIFAYVKKGQTVTTRESYGGYDFKAYGLQYGLGEASGGSSANNNYDTESSITLHTSTTAGSYDYTIEQDGLLYIRIIPTTTVYSGGRVAVNGVGICGNSSYQAGTVCDIYNSFRVYKGDVVTAVANSAGCQRLDVILYPCK